MSQKSKRPPFIRRGQIFQAHGERFEALANSRPMPGTVEGISESIVRAIGLSEDTYWPEPTNIPVVEDDRYTFIEARKLQPYQEKVVSTVRPISNPTPDIPTFLLDPEPVDFRTAPSAFVDDISGSWAGLSPA